MAAETVTFLGILALTASAFFSPLGGSVRGRIVDGPTPLTVTATLFGAPEPSDQPRPAPTASSVAHASPPTPGTPETTRTPTVPAQDTAVPAPPTGTTRATPSPETFCTHVTDVNAWDGGVVVSITLTNASSTSWTDWQGTFVVAPGAVISNSWGATFSVSGSTFTLIPASYHVVVPPGTSVTVGFQATTTTTSITVADVSVQGRRCQAPSVA